MEARDIPDEEVPDYGVKIWIGAPPGEEAAIEGVEAVGYIAALSDTQSIPARAVRVELDSGDLENLTKTGRFWITFFGDVVVPFAVNVELPEGETIEEEPTEPWPESVRSVMAPTEIPRELPPVVPAPESNEQPQEQHPGKQDPTGGIGL